MRERSEIVRQAGFLMARLARRAIPECGMPVTGSFAASAIASTRALEIARGAKAISVAVAGKSEQVLEATANGIVFRALSTIAPAHTSLSTPDSGLILPSRSRPFCLVSRSKLSLQRSELVFKVLQFAFLST